MNYTREPIIETVITPKEGCKLVVRPTKGIGQQEDYFVDAVEIVSYGNAIFFRSLERPKSFLLPVTDFEVIELKETKMVLKNVGIEKSIKIAGGKEPQRKATEEASRKRRRPPRRRKQIPQEVESKEPIQEIKKGGEKDDETQVSSSIIRKLFPPPPTLIKEKLNHYKTHEDVKEDVITSEIVKEEPAKKAVEENLEIVKEETAKEVKAEEDQPSAE